MNTTQNIHRTIAAAVIAASAGLALSSCAEQLQPPAPNAESRSQAEAGTQRGEYRDLAERRIGLGGPVVRGSDYRDLAERRVGLGSPVVRGSDYRDLAERRIGLGGPVVRASDYRDLAERRIGLDGPVARDSVHHLTGH